MFAFEVRFQDGLWHLMGAGTLGGDHVESSKERIEAYVDGFMSLRSGRVIFYRPDGGVEQERVYEAHDLQLWAASRAGGRNGF